MQWIKTVERQFTASRWNLWSGNASWSVGCEFEQT